MKNRQKFGGASPEEDFVSASAVITPAIRRLYLRRVYSNTVRSDTIAITLQLLMQERQMVAVNVWAAANQFYSKYLRPRILIYDTTAHNTATQDRLAASVGRKWRIAV